MRYVAILGMVCLTTVGSAIGCDDTAQTTDPTGGNGGAGGSEMGGMGGSGGTGGAAMGGMGGSGGGMAAVVIHGCEQSKAVDETANTAVKVTFGADNKYTPACVRVKKGTKVTFEGTFSSHPMSPGEYKFPPMPDLTSTIQPTAVGAAVTFTMDTVGTFPYYCDYHASSGMVGVVYVE